MTREKALEKIAKLRDEVEDRLQQIAGLADEYKVIVQISAENSDLAYYPAVPTLWVGEKGQVTDNPVPGDLNDVYQYGEEGAWGDVEYWQSSTGYCENYNLIGGNEETEVI